MAAAAHTPVVVAAHNMLEVAHNNQEAVHKLVVVHIRLVIRNLVELRNQGVRRSPEARRSPRPSPFQIESPRLGHRVVLHHHYQQTSRYLDQVRICCSSFSSFSSFY